MTITVTIEDREAEIADQLEEIVEHPEHRLGDEVEPAPVDQQLEAVEVQRLVIGVDQGDFLGAGEQPRHRRAGRTQLRQPELLETLERALADNRLDPARLELEITESVFLDPSKDLILELLRRVAELGVTLAIDDFGTGYSSLAYLKHFPFHEIKVDGSFVRDIEDGADGAAIVKAVVALGHSLGKRVTAEGVETEEQLAFLRERGCDAAQGYLLGRPGPAEAVGRLLAEAA